MENPFLYRVFTDISDDVYVEEELAKYRLYSPEKAFPEIRATADKEINVAKTVVTLFCCCNCLHIVGNRDRAMVK